MPTDKDELIFSGKTNKQGVVSLKNIPVGKYYIVEKEPATGYVLSEEKVYFEAPASETIIN